MIENSNTKIYKFDDNDFSRYKEELIEKFPKTNEIKLKEFFSSRYPLLQLLGLNDFSKVDLDNHFQLIAFTKLKCSFSHTGQYGACIISDSHQVGIDIEHKERTFNPNIEKKFMNNLDEISGSLLERWCTKEAAFKALKNSSVKTLKDIRLLKNQRFQFENIHGYYSFEPHQELIVVKAIVPSP
jgi:phosphopantetheinyl transferase